MADTFKIVQAQEFTVVASGVSLGATSIILSSFKQIDGTTNLTMTDFGSIGYGTLSPNTSRELQISFTGVTQNANGTATLTGVKSVLNVDPYTETSGVTVSQAGNSVFVISNTAGFYGKFAVKGNDETVTGDWDFTGDVTVPTPISGTNAVNKDYADSLSIAGAPDASTIVKGIARNSVSSDVSLGAVTITIATPAVVTLTSHGLTLNDSVVFSTSGTLPTGITAGTTYYVISAGLTANTFQVSLTLGGSAVNTTGTQSGTHTLTKTTPISVGTLDPRVPTQSENDALVGTDGLPSSTNPFVTESDTTGSGSVVRESLLESYSQGVTSYIAGENITSGDALHLSDSIQTDGGIKYDSSATNAYSNLTNQTLSLTVGNNSNRLLLVQVVTIAATTPSSVTYNGSSMTLIRTAGTGTFRSHVYRLIAPTVGTNNISVTSANIYQISGYSIYNVDQTTPVELDYDDSGTASSFTRSITNLTKGAVLVGFQYVSGLSGTLTSTRTVSTPYFKNGATNSNFISTFTGSTIAVNVGMTEKINKLQTDILEFSMTLSGGGSPQGALVSLCIKPATAVSTGVLKADCDVSVMNEPLINFCGIAKTTATIGNSVDVFMLGSIANTISSLTVGSNYYLSTTAGMISTTQPSSTYSVLVGTAKSATEFIVRKEKTMGQNITKDNSYTYTAECDGFIGTTTSMVPIQKNQTYSFSSGTNFLKPLA